MLRCSHQTSLYRVVLNIFQLLQHHLIIRHFLWMRSLLPHLMLALHFVLGSKITELIQ